MSHAICIESQSIAEELYRLIKTLESSSWSKEIERIQQDLQALTQRLRQTLEQLEWPERSAAMEGLRERLQQLSRVVREAMPNTNAASESMKTEWRAFRKRLVPVYDSLAATLKLQDIHVPSLRPTNYLRNVFHVTNGILVSALLYFVGSPKKLFWVGLPALLTVWTLETLRRSRPRLNAVLMKVFGKVAHPHEHYRVNSATWYTTALFCLTLFADVTAGALALIVLAFGDPFAAIIGRKFGRTKIYAGRSLEGTLAFVGIATLAGMAVVSIFAPQSTWFMMVLLALAAAVPGALAELFTQRLDDNFTIPVTAALSVTAVQALLPFLLA